jgi:hypothetical protein
MTMLLPRSYPLRKSLSIDGVPALPGFVISCIGKAPLLMHNGRLIDPLDTIVKQIHEVSSKTRKTDDDHWEMAKLEWLGGIYYEREVGPFIPAWNLQKSIVEGARLSRDGKKIERGVVFDSVVLPLEYDGPRDPIELFEDKQFVSRMPVRVSSARVMRTRPRFKKWRLKASGQYDGSVLDLADLRRAADMAGAMIGLGDSRPAFGRFTAEVEGGDR